MRDGMKGQRMATFQEKKFRASRHLKNEFVFFFFFSQTLAEFDTDKINF